MHGAQVLACDDAGMLGRWLSIAFLVVAVGCGEPVESDAGTDAAALDSGLDAGRDAGSITLDASGMEDAGGARDAASADAASADAASADAASADAALPEDAAVDAGAADGGHDGAADADVSCAPGTLDCTSAAGCETSAIDPAHCGACGISCNWGACSAGGCDPLAIESGDDMTCVIRASGDVHCWGGAPGPALSGFTGAVQLDISGNDDACAVLASGGVVCWDGPEDTPSPQSGVTDAAEVAVTHSQICIRRRSGEVGCRPLGTTFPFTPVPGITDAIDLAAGFAYVCAALSDGTARCWGDNTYGTLGDGTTGNSPTPVVVAGVSDVVAIESSRRHVCARTSAGWIYCWGDNTRGQVGAGSTAMLRPTPSRIGAFAGALDVACGDWHTCVLEAAGTIACFGYDGEGQFGDGMPTSTPLRSPGRMTAGVTDARELAAGEDHTCALRASGAYCWGEGGLGQLGDGMAASGALPVAVASPP